MTKNLKKSFELNDLEDAEKADNLRIQASILEVIFKSRPMMKTTITTDEANEIILELTMLILLLGGTCQLRPLDVVDGKYVTRDFYGRLKGETLDYTPEMKLSLVVAGMIGARPHMDLNVNIQLHDTDIMRRYIFEALSRVKALTNESFTTDSLMIAEAIISLCEALIHYMTKRGIQ